MFLRLTHLTSDNIWYSAGFYVTQNNVGETTRIAYKAERYFSGVDYAIFPYFQTIRLRCFGNDIDPSTDAEETVGIYGAVHSLRQITTKVDKHVFHYCNEFIYNRILEVLKHPIVYIDGYRHNTGAQKLSKGERWVPSPFFECSFDTNPTTERLDYEYTDWDNR